MGKSLEEIMEIQRKYQAATEHREKMQEFALNLDRYQKKHGITQTELARRMGYSKKRVGQLMYLGDDRERYKISRIPRIDTLIPLALALGADVEDILPNGDKVEERIDPNKDPDSYKSVEAFVNNLLAQFYQYRDKVAEDASKNLKIALSLRNVTEAVLNLYAELESVDAHTKCYTLSNAIRSYYRKGLMNRWDIEQMLSDLLEMYLMDGRPEEQQAYWQFEAKEMMETIKARREQEYEEIEVLASDFLEGPEVGDSRPIAWDEMEPIDFEKMF